MRSEHSRIIYGILMAAFLQAMVTTAVIYGDRRSASTVVIKRMTSGTRLPDDDVFANKLLIFKHCAQTLTNR